MTTARVPVTEALYRAEGKPVLDKAGEPREGLSCGNCRARTTVVSAGSVLTSRFGSWDDIIVGAEGERFLCLPCAWTYRSVPLRRSVTLVTTGPSLARPTGAQVRTLLQGPLPADVALIVPLSGKRIVAPRARWGQVAVDTGPFTWSASHARLLRLAVRLRGWGFGEKAMAESAPPFEILSRIRLDAHDDIRGAWREFEPARADKTMLGCYLRLSRETP